mmetsp:Transcript_33116/g.24360  ORF Transcript_33116/g.24360 Transcript_33116/m.24360 type:complete len:93 (-) Transcript_33116:255-533(-)
MTYKEMLDNQINVKNQLKLYGNMTDMEKKLNKQDLDAYKVFDNKQYSLIPGLHSQKQVLGTVHQQKPKVDQAELYKRLDQYGYGRGFATMIN